MYGKWFASAYTGSMAGAGADVFAVWGYVVAHAGYGYVELNPAVVGALIGMAVENVKRAIEFLCQPDPASRNQDQDGCRLVHDYGFRYLVVSQPMYRDRFKSEEGRREYLRVKQQESRAKHPRKQTSKTVKPVNSDVNNGQQPSTNGQQPSTHVDQAEAEAEVKAKKDQKPSRAKKREEGKKTKTEIADERHQEFKAEILAYWKSKNPDAECPWDGSEGKALGMWLASSPKTDVKQFRRFLYNRYLSDEWANHAERPSLWIRNITSYANGPLGPYGKPIKETPNHTGGKPNGRSTAQAKQNATLAAMDSFVAGVQGVDRTGTGEDRDSDRGGSQQGATGPERG